MDRSPLSRSLLPALLNVQCACQKLGNLTHHRVEMLQFLQVARTSRLVCFALGMVCLLSVEIPRHDAKAVTRPFRAYVTNATCTEVEVDFLAYRTSLLDVAHVEQKGYHLSAHT